MRICESVLGSIINWSGFDKSGFDNIREENMITREELITSEEYILVKLQTELFNHIEEYLKKNKMSRTAFAEKLGVTKGYVSQVLNGAYDFRLSKLIELALAIGYVPSISFVSKAEHVAKDAALGEPSRMLNSMESPMSTYIGIREATESNVCRIEADLPMFFKKVV